MDKWAYYASAICPGVLSMMKNCCTGTRIKDELLHIKDISEIADQSGVLSPVNPYIINGGKIKLIETIDDALGGLSKQRG